MLYCAVCKGIGREDTKGRRFQAENFAVCFSRFKGKRSGAFIGSEGKDGYADSYRNNGSFAAAAF